MRAGHTEFQLVVRLDTARETDYYRHGGIMKYLLRDILRDHAT